MSRTDNMYSVRMSINACSARRLLQGFSLIELMVGLVIGLLTTIAVTQVYSAWVKQSRTVSSTNDSQSTIALAAYALEEDLKQAGLGLGDASSASTGGAGCPILGDVVTTSIVTNGVTSDTTEWDPAAKGPLRLIGVQIVNGANQAPDQIISLYGSSAYRTASEVVISSVSNIVRLRNRAGFNEGDVVVLADANAADCRIVEITSAATTDAELGDKGFKFDTTYATTLQTVGNSVARAAVFNSDKGVTGLTIKTAFNLGQSPKANKWSISTASPNSAANPALQKLSMFPINGVYPKTVAREVAEGIVDLQAQYGYDADGNGRIDNGEWVDADSANKPDITEIIPAASLDWRKVLAIRYALLSRSRNYEPLPYSAIKPTWDGAKVDPNFDKEPVGFRMTDVGSDKSTDPKGEKDWHQYRYSVVQGVVPLRNILWARNQ